MIPRVFHQIWVGADPIPETFVEYQETWRRHHPDWEMRLWTEDNLPELTRPEGYDRMRNPSERGDLIRYELLRSFGGVYIDMDTECLRPIDELVEGIDFFVGYIVDERKGEKIVKQRIGSSIIGASAHHPVMERAVCEAKAHEVFGHNKEDSGPIFLDDLLKDFPELTRYPLEYFYSKTSEESENAYLIHHEARAWRTHADLNEAIKRMNTKARKLTRRVWDRDAEIKLLRKELVQLRRELDKSERKREKLEAQLRSGLAHQLRASIARTRLGGRLERR
jgi:mannosyltransferase OCH1-like enzyme